MVVKTSGTLRKTTRSSRPVDILRKEHSVILNNAAKVDLKRSIWNGHGSADVSQPHFLNSRMLVYRNCHQPGVAPCLSKFIRRTDAGTDASRFGLSRQARSDNLSVMRFKSGEQVGFAVGFVVVIHSNRVPLIQLAIQIAYCSSAYTWFYRRSTELMRVQAELNTDH